METTRRVDVSGQAIAYRAPVGLPRAGEPALLCIHGAGGSAAHFDGVLAHLPASPCVVAVDLPGHGASGGAVPASLEAIVGVLHGFLDVLEIDGPIACLGHSFGGLAAFALALRRPDQVERVVAIASAARFRPHPDFARQAASGRWDAARVDAGFARGAPAAARGAVLRDLRRLRLPDASLGALAGADLSARLPELAAPVLCLVPGADVIVSPRRGRDLARALPRCRLVTVPGAGHYLHLERPRAVASAIRGFLASGYPTAAVA
jgi:pimeloyl-ACP methyl ester carboxylesterase